MPTAPFYQDWTFWQWVVSLTALFVAIIPPIKRMLTGPKLSLDAYNRMLITHTIGNPNINLLVMLRNIGGQPVRVRAISLEIKPSVGAAFTLHGGAYFPDPSESKRVVLAPFKLAPDQEWSYSISFFQPFSRNDEKYYRQIVSNVRNDIAAKHPSLQKVEADPAVVMPVINFFNQKFRWHPGEYEAKLTALTDMDNVNVTRTVRFTLFESDSSEIHEYSQEYKYGLGVTYYDSVKQPGIWVELSAI